MNSRGVLSVCERNIDDRESMHIRMNAKIGEKRTAANEFQLNVNGNESKKEHIIETNRVLCGCMTTLCAVYVVYI